MPPAEAAAAGLMRYRLGMKLVQFLLSLFKSAPTAAPEPTVEAPVEEQKPIPTSWAGPAPRPKGLPTIRPDAVTHIILLADPSESLKEVEDLEQKILRVWTRTNRDMAKAITSAGLAPPVHYVEVPRYMAGIPGVDSDHFVGEHLYELGVEENHSVLVQMLEVRIGGEMRDITLETVHRTEKPRCVISKKALQPAD